jgi:GDP-4-dehydro-6-deoxy-D-mannose reductase
MRVLLTGAAGFVGPYLIGALRTRGHELHAVDRLPADDRLDRPALRALVEVVRPEAILHLAGITFVPEAARDPETAYRVNLHGTLAVLDALREQAPSARLLHVSSSDVYGAVTPQDLPVTETTPLRPLSVYAATKAAAEIAVGQWGRAHKLDVVIVRPFNHTGPGQGPSFVCSALARQVALAECGAQPPILQVGDMNPIRDFSDVRDIVTGYADLLERGRTGEIYNLCSEVGTSVADVIAILRGIATMPLGVYRDPALRRPVDVLRIVGSAEKARTEVGWKPAYTIETTLADAVASWRTAVKPASARTAQPA